MNQETNKNSSPLAETVGILWRSRYFILQGAVVLTLLMGIAGTIYYFMQDVRYLAWMEFRPNFPGADKGRYPNQLRFAPSDITNPVMVDLVWEINHLEPYCSQEEFRSSFVVQESSSNLQFLEMEYGARLSDVRLSSVERQRIQEEFQAKKDAVALQYRLYFIRPFKCAKLPAALISKSMVEVLEKWAIDADVSRGVSRMRVAVLSPDIFDPVSTERPVLLVRADLARSALTRVIVSVKEMQKLAGSELIRLGEEQNSFALVRARLEDLVQSQLDPLLATAGPSLAREAQQWVEQSLRVAQMSQRAAQSRADAIRDALRDYSGVLSSPGGRGSAPGKQASEPSQLQQTLQTNLDRNFIDRLVELSAPNVTYRQELTTKFIDASNEAINFGGVVEHYQALLNSLSRARESTMTAAEVEKRLDFVISQGKLYTTQLEKLYDEFGRVAVRPAGELYTISSPINTQIVRNFGLRYFAMVLAGTMVISPILLGLFCIGRARWRRLTADL